MIKAIFFDIDGTLVSFHTHKVPPSTIETIRKVREKGVKVFIATGRPLPFVNNLGDMQFDGIITVNGACCQTADGTTICSEPINREDLLRLVSYHHEHPYPIAFASNEQTFITTMAPEPQEVFRLLDLEAPKIAPIETCLQIEVMQMVAFLDSKTQEHVLTNVLQDCDAQRWHPLFVDIIHKGHSKAVGIDRMIRHYGIKLEETMAFGDGGNDIAMLSHVGFGVAMGNARDEVKQAAKYVTESVDNDGIANALNKFVLEE